MAQTRPALPTTRKWMPIRHGLIGSLLEDISRQALFAAPFCKIKYGDLAPDALADLLSHMG